jgi:hypothetical protein
MAHPDCHAGSLKILPVFANQFIQLLDIFKLIEVQLLQQFYRFVDIVISILDPILLTFLIQGPRNAIEGSISPIRSSTFNFFSVKTSARRILTFMFYISWIFQSESECQRKTVKMSPVWHKEKQKVFYMTAGKDIIVSGDIFFWFGWPVRTLRQLFRSAGHCREE